MRFHRRTAALIAVVLILIGTGAVLLAANLPVLWTAGGLDAGTTGAGQSARMAVDAMGNVAIVSGPALNSQDLAVTSYTQDGTFRWRTYRNSRHRTFHRRLDRGLTRGRFRRRRPQHHLHRQSDRHHTGSLHVRRHTAVAARYGRHGSFRRTDARG